MLQHKWFTSCLTFYEVGNIRRWELFTYSSRVHAAPGQIDYSYVQTNQYHTYFWFFNANMPCRTVRWVVLLWTRITVHTFIHFCRIMFWWRALTPTPLPFPTGPVLHRWLVGFYLSNLFSFIPSLCLLFSFLKPTVNEYAELDKSALKRLLGLSVFCPPFSFIVSSLSPTPCWFSSKFPKRLIKFLQINAHQLHTSHFYTVPATFIFLDSHAKTK